MQASSTRFKVVFYPALLFLLALAGLLGGCKKEPTLSSGGELRFSTDTLTFDTVFTTQASFTCSLRLYNPQPERVVVSSIRMKGGAASPFKINVDGIAGDGSNSVSNLSIAGNDSAFVYATVTIDPNNADNPFVIEDALQATLNGRTFSIPAIAYGQNAHYIVNDTDVSGALLTDKPYVFIGYAIVKENQTLTIPPKCRLYMHANARIFVDGTLAVNGTKEDSVIFQGDRLDRAYFGFTGYPGEWGGIYFTENSRGNVLHYATLRNCGASTQLGGGVAQPAAIQVNSGTDLKLDRCTIENSIGYGILSFSGTVTAENCLISQTGAQGLALLQGGTYAFKNCTFSTYGTQKINHSENSVAAFQNYFKYSDALTVDSPLNATLTNCIIWGGLETEFFVNRIGSKDCNVTLTNCLVRRKNPLDNFINAANTSISQDPQFQDPGKLNFELKDGSPAIDAGDDSIIFQLFNAAAPLSDLKGNPRRGGNGKIDIGAYEHQ